MTSALAHTAAVDHVDLERYVSLLEAAKLLGRTTDQLGRQCRLRLHAAGLAIKTTPPSGGKWQ